MAIILYPAASLPETDAHRTPILAAVLRAIGRRVHALKLVRTPLDT